MNPDSRCARTPVATSTPSLSADGTRPIASSYPYGEEHQRHTLEGARGILSHQLLFSPSSASVGRRATGTPLPGAARAGSYRGPQASSSFPSISAGGSAPRFCARPARAHPRSCACSRPLQRNDKPARSIEKHAASPAGRPGSARPPELEPDVEYRWAAWRAAPRPGGLSSMTEDLSRPIHRADRRPVRRLHHRHARQQAADDRQVASGRQGDAPGWSSSCCRIASWVSCSTP